MNLTLNIFSRECEHSSHTHCEGTVTVCWKFKLRDGVSVDDISEWVSFTKAFLYLNTFFVLKINFKCFLLTFTISHTALTALLALVGICNCHS